jgi:exopolysaccharide production protein ExoQ
MLQFANEIERENIQPRINQFFPTLANLTFILFIFFSFFGTALPFREKITEVDDLATSNIVNQIVFTLLFITSLISILPKYKTVLGIIKKEKILTIFILWSLASVIWSEYSFVSFKRWFQYFTGFTVGLSVMVHVDFSEVLLQRIKYLFYLYVLISIVSIMIIPGATDRYGIWRGIAPSKNHLGQAALISSLILFYSVSTEAGLKRIMSFFFFVIGIILLVGSQSLTAQSTFLFIIALSVVFYFDRHFRHYSIGRFVTYIIVLGFTALFVSVITFAPEIIENIVGSAGRDLTFTGRTELWEDILRETSKYWIHGAGFQGFWVVDNPHLLALYDIYIWLPNQAHNGYVDIINELGIIGLLLFILVLINYFRGLFRLKLPHYWKWFVIAAIIINFQETTFIRPQVVTGVMFMFSYIALFSDLYRKDSDLEEEDSAMKLNELNYEAR